MRIAVLSVVLILFGAGVRAEPVAMIVRLSGKAEVNHKPAVLMHKLQIGDEVECVSGKVGIVMVVGSQRFQLSSGQKGRVAADAVGGDATRMAGLRPPSIEASRKLENTLAGVNFARPLGDVADLMPAFSGWLPSGTRHFSWHRNKGEADLFQVSRNPRLDPNLRPAKYRFSLFDARGNLLWSDIAATDEIDCPALDLKDKTAYIWRIDPYKQDGTPLGANGGGMPKWGIVTFLTPKQSQELTQAAEEINKAIAADPTDSSLRVLLAYTYSAHAVPMAAIIELRKIQDQDTTSALENIYRETGSLASYFAGFGVRADRGVEGENKP